MEKVIEASVEEMREIINDLTSNVEYEKFRQIQALAKFCADYIFRKKVICEKN